MSNAKYTPAPWSANWNGSYYQIDTETEGQIGDACASQFIEGNTDKGKANARLIAAAPEVWEALEDVMAWIDNWEPDMTGDDEWSASEERVRAAIAKATGGT